MKGALASLAMIGGAGLALCAICALALLGQPLAAWLVGLDK